MPLYEYECEACHHHLEAQQKLAEAPLKTCPACGKDQLQRLISATSFTLKGGGWYKDLYSSAKPGSTTDGASTSSPARSTSSGSSGSGDKGDKGGSSSGSSGSSGGSSSSGSGGGSTSSASAA